MTDSGHNLIFRQTHVECSICGNIWYHTPSRDAISQFPCVPKEETGKYGEYFPGSIPDSSIEIFSIRFDLPVPIDIDLRNSTPPIIPASFRVTHIELYETDDETRDKGAVLLDEWLKDTGDV